MIVAGDIHGLVKPYLRLLKSYKGEPSVQIGDFGFGFGKGSGPDDVGLKTPEELQWLEDNMPDNAWFFRGNHDNPELADKSPHCLGDYGVDVIDGHLVFFLAGAWSTDSAMRRDPKEIRKYGVTWWSGEELSLENLEDALQLYKDSRPDVVLTHDGPDQAVEVLQAVTPWLHKGRYPSRTGTILTAMFEAYQPPVWCFGHWHTKFDAVIRGTRFRCVPSNGWVQLHGEFRKNKSVPALVRPAGGGGGA